MTTPSREPGNKRSSKCHYRYHRPQKMCDLFHSEASFPPPSRMQFRIISLVGLPEMGIFGHVATISLVSLLVL